MRVCCPVCISLNISLHVCMCLSLCLCISLSMFVCVSPSLCLYVSLPLHCSIRVCYPVSLSLLRVCCHSFTHKGVLSLSLFLPRSVYYSLRLAGLGCAVRWMCVSLSIFLSLSVSLLIVTDVLSCVFVSLSTCVCLSLSLSYWMRLRVCCPMCVCLSLYVCLSLTLRWLPCSMYYTRMSYVQILISTYSGVKRRMYKNRFPHIQDWDEGVLLHAGVVCIIHVCHMYKYSFLNVNVCIHSHFIFQNLGMWNLFIHSVKCMHMHRFVNVKCVHILCKMCA